MYTSSTTADNNSGGDTDFSSLMAEGLGYMVGLGSLLLYTPIAVRLCRQKHADGLVISTWWLKAFSYLLSDIYYVRKQYNLSTYAETVVITVESVVVLFLVALYQQKYRELGFWACLVALIVYTVWGFRFAPDALVATGQIVSSVVNALALVPQFWHNYTHRTKGDYSPLTAGLAVAGCAVRVFTTITLNGSDPVLLLTFGVALLLNGSLLLQILYYGTVVEGLSAAQVLLADVLTATPSDASSSGSRHQETGYRGLHSDDEAEEEDPLSALQDREDAANNGGSNHNNNDDDDPTNETENSSLRRRTSYEIPDADANALV